VLKLTLVDNKVARRIIVSFILAALIPIVIFGLLSMQEIRHQLQEQTTTYLHQKCKDYAMGLLARLEMAERNLQLISGQIEKSTDVALLNDLGSNNALVQQFLRLAVIDPTGKKTQLVGDASLIPELTVRELLVIGNGKTFIKSTAESNLNSSRLWMAQNLIKNQPGSGILIGELNPETIWDIEDTAPSNLWVLDNTSQILISSEQGIELPAKRRERFPSTNSGQFSFIHENTPYEGTYWKIPMKGMYTSADLIIVLAQPEALAFESIQQFSSIYPPVIVLTVLIVAFFITRLIIKYLSPLDQLKMATLKIADGDFTSHVDINSRDEFQALADSFNEMTRRLRSQFDILSAMAEIDRHILSSLNAGEIVETALNRLPNVLFCDLIAIAHIDPTTYWVSDIHSRRTGQGTKILTGAIKLTLQDTLDLLAAQDSVIEAGNDTRFSEFFDTIAQASKLQYLLVPVVVNGVLYSIISLGYLKHKMIPPESRTAARNFGDRIAVALSNAAWEEKLYQQAHFDSLTGLPNRLVLNDRLLQELARARRDNTQIAVIFIDVDRFKVVNDSLGHSAGDELLTKLAHTFVNAVRETDLVVRIGGDEFVIVITDINEDINLMSNVSAVAEKILASLSQTLVIEDQPMTISASLGIATFPKDADNSQDLLKNADAAMYHAKDAGRNTFRFYSPELNAAALENIKLEHELRGAIKKGELILFYQPKFDVSRRIVGAEALVRWQHSELGLVSPAKFIPLAEQTGLIFEIGNWVLEQTCLLVNFLQDLGIKPVRISVNLSGIEFKRPELVEKVSEILSRTGANPDFIELELTESVAIGDINSCIERMNELKGLGLTLTMDDFGTGFSSLSYLKSLPLDVIKVDQSFIRQIESGGSSQAIVTAIIALAEGLGMDVVAEGVETEAQLEFLKQHRCGIFQGFLFSRPIPSEDFISLLN
jgi:diguanylate cyclase (GGDEF)-like protein